MLQDLTVVYQQLMLYCYRELDSFLTLLNNTLHLSPSAAKELPDAPTGDCVNTKRLGRLDDRIIQLRRELVKGMGEELFYKSRHLLDTGSDDLEEIEVMICVVTETIGYIFTIATVTTADWSSVV